MRAKSVKAGKPRYTLPTGKGWGVCEAYLKFLNALPADAEPLTCDLMLNRVPGMREPDWEELDISQNIKTVHQIEVLLGVGRIEPAPDKDFDRWLIQREARIKANGEQPRLRRARLPVVAGGAVETVLSYNVDVKQCERQVGIARTGKPYTTRLGAPNFFIYDEARQRVVAGSFWVGNTPGALAIYRDKPYYFDLAFGNHNWDIGGHLYIKRLEPVLPTELRLYTFPNDPLYIGRELCRIRFDYPFPRP